MRNKFLLKALTVCLLSLSLVSCKKDKDEPANVVEDASGLVVNLGWTMTDGSSAAANADLDIYLYSGTGTTKVPTSYYSDDVNTSSESFTFPSTMPDGDYTLSVDYFEVLKNGSHSFTFTGATSGSTDTYSVNNIGFTTADEGTEKDKIKINKSGNKFTVTQL